MTVNLMYWQNVYYKIQTKTYRKQQW